jgi:hypothetical protein
MTTAVTVAPEAPATMAARRPGGNALLVGNGGNGGSGGNGGANGERGRYRGAANRT